MPPTRETRTEISCVAVLANSPAATDARQRNGLAVPGWLAALLLACSLCLPAQASDYQGDAPRLVALLEQAETMNHPPSGFRDPLGAVVLYCHASTMGSAEAFYRIGQLLRESNSPAYDPGLANAYLAQAAQLGHHAAADLLDPQVARPELPEDCSRYARLLNESRFDIERFLAALPAHKRKIANLIRSQSPHFGVDARFALAIALAESNLEATAVSPKNAQGVMQLIPDTQARFGVRKPFDPASNIRGALAYLRWLGTRFKGNWSLVAAAYNAGEGAVEKYDGIPPYAETRQYVARVLYFAGYVGQQAGKAQKNKNNNEYQRKSPQASSGRPDRGTI